MKVSRETLALLTALAALATAGEARAEDSRPQWNTALVTGLAFERGPADERHRPMLFAAHGDVILGRSSNRSWGVGPMARVGTYRFRDLQAQGGVSLLIPSHEYLPFVLSGGAMVRKDGISSPGVFGSLFWGSRSFNHHGSYVLVGGLVLEARKDLGGDRSSAFVVGAHLDGEVLSLPILMLVNAFR